MVLAMAWPRRLFSAGISAGATVRRWMTSASASSTTAGQITTPGETPMPLRISMEVSGPWPVVSGQFFYWPLTTGHRPLLFLAKLALKQFSQFFDCFFGVVSLGLYL